MSFLVAIPARYDSTRFPGKPLALIAGEPMIIQVLRGVLKEKRVRHIAVMTDDDRIRLCVQKFADSVSGSIKIEAVMTKKECPTGTDRIREGLSILENQGQKFNFVLNVQGDEPLISAIHLGPIIDAFLSDASLHMATLGTRLERRDLSNMNVVKVIFDKNQNAIYFSRFAIPFSRMTEDQLNFDTQDKLVSEKECVLKHIGLYGYAVGFLNEFCKTPMSFLEKAESLEQLRALSMGYKIRVLPVNQLTLGIDTPEDLKYLNEKIEQGQIKL